ncbi:hypothetical protein [Isoptericola sp. NPDC057559]|uniref:hypothetical protein n=1 Tax=Isoptericola sp. NPDC057559 TaxID=3346168 RepID=UPI003694CD7D
MSRSAGVRGAGRRQGRALLGAGLTALLVLSGAAAGSATTGRVVVTDGVVEVQAEVRVGDVAAANQTDAVVDLTFTSDAGSVAASPGIVRVRGPQGEAQTLRTGTVDGSRQRVRPWFTSGDPAGTYTVDVLDLELDVTAADGTVRHLVMQQDAAATFVVRPESQLTVDVAPQVVPKGQKVYVHGDLAVAGPERMGSWARYVPAAGATVKLYLDPSGSAPRVYRGSATVDEDGHFGRELTADVSGTWSAEYAGTTSRALAREAAPMTVRTPASPVRSAIATTTVKGETLRARVIVPRSVTVGLTPKTLVADIAFLFPHQSGNATYLAVCHRTPSTCAGNDVFGDAQIWDDNTARELLYIDASYPAGTYRVGLYSGGFRTYQENESARVTFKESRTVTTFQVKHATRTGAKASRSRVAKGAGVVLSGRFSEARAKYGVAGYYGAKGAKLRVYFDPAGPAGPDYRKSVTTGAGGVYRVTVRPTKAGTWIVKYPGSSTRASSKDSVRVTVR